VAEYRVDELAQAAGTSVRNVRVYQERGLLPPPRRVGRTGVYTETHLARLRLIRMLLQRGYTFATIGELIEAWTAGQGLAELLGIDDILAVPWSDEKPEVRDTDRLVDAFGDLAGAPQHLTRAAELGLIELDDDSVVVRSPKLVEAGAQLVAAGVPVQAILDLASNLQTHFDDIARQLFGIFDTYVAKHGRSATEVADALLRLRPFARQTADALLLMALERESQRILEQRAKRSRKTRKDGESPADGESREAAAQGA
jgi:DNA-binding transcriptional MerR regulator